MSDDAALVSQLLEALGESSETKIPIASASELAPAQAPLDISFDFTRNDADSVYDDGDNDDRHARQSSTPTVNDTGTIDHDHVQDLPIRQQQPSNARVQVEIPEISVEQRSQYEAIYSENVDHVISSVVPPRGIGMMQYNVEFTDGREAIVCHRDPATVFIIFCRHG